MIDRTAPPFGGAAGRGHAPAVGDQGLGPEARALLDLARDGLSPDAAAIHRVRGKLAATAGAAAGTALGVKLALVSLAIAVVAGAGLYLRRDRVTAVAPPVIELVAAPPAVPAPSPHDVAPPPSPHDVAPPPRKLAPPRAAPVQVARPAARVASAPDPAPRPASLAREIELVDLAMAALRAQRPDDALRAVRRHATETDGRGQLAEDAAAIEIEAMCQLHDDATSTQLAAFDARFPHSAQRSRLTTRCPP